MYETPYTNDRHGSVALFLLDTEVRALNNLMLGLSLKVSRSTWVKRDMCFIRSVPVIPYRACLEKHTRIAMSFSMLLCDVLFFLF